MADMVELMEQLRTERVSCLEQLEENTRAMQAIAAEADRVGHSGYRIAQLLGVTNRTVYMWLKG